MARIFISRYLTDDSVFRMLATEAGHEVHGESLLQIYPVAIEALPISDWLFFYSANGVHYLMEQLNSRLTDLRSVRYAVMGEGTADKLRSYGVEPEFVGAGDPVATAELFGQVALGQRVTFVQAANSRQSVMQLLGGRILSTALVVYRSAIRAALPKVYCDIAALTSPLNVAAYLEAAANPYRTPMVAIGRATAQEATYLGVECVYTAVAPSERALAIKALQIVNGEL